MRRVLLVGLLLVACGSHVESSALGQPTASATATRAATPTQAATVTPSPSPTPRPNPTVGPGTYTSVALAYRVDIPQGWRRSACQSTRGITQPPAVEAFTAASVDEESGTDMGAGQDIVDVMVQPSGGQTALAWLESGKMGFSTQSHFEKATIDGKDAARVVPNDGSPSGVMAIAARGNIYALTQGVRGTIASANGRSALALMNSIHILSDAELQSAKTTLATPAPEPLRSAEDVADTLARGFAQKDTAVLASVASPCLTLGFEQAGPSFSSTSKALARLQQSFAAGLVVTVQPRPLLDQTQYNANVRFTCTLAGKPTTTAKLMLVNVGGTWYWDGWLYAQVPGC